MTYHHISYETIDDAIAVVTLSRPERLNALHGPMMEELTQAIGRIEGDDHIRAFILTGRPRSDGRPCFSAGVDIKATLEGNTIGTGIGFNLTNQIDDMLKPSIAVIDGVCSTGAVELALACDLRLVGEQAQISDWHLKNLGTGLGGWGGEYTVVTPRGGGPYKGDRPDGEGRRCRGGVPHRIRDRLLPVGPAHGRGAVHGEDHGLYEARGCPPDAGPPGP